MKKKKEERMPLRIAVCVPTRGECDYKFTQQLAELMGMMGATVIRDRIADVTLMMLPGTYIDKTRSQLTQEAVKWGATHILWLDDDMIFPPHTFHQLLKRKQPIVGVNYSTRKQPLRPVTFKKLPDHLTGYEGERCYTTEESVGLEAVEGIGFGVVLMETSVLGKVKYPGFLCEYSPEAGIWIGEDIYFCREAIKAGYTVWVDHDLSKEIGHAGRFVYQNAHATAVRDLDLKMEEQSESRLVIPGGFGRDDRIIQRVD